MAWRRRSERVDTDQADVVDRLRDHGCSVEVIGQPLDLLIGAHGVNLLAEVKSPPGPRGGTAKDGQKLNDKQRDFVAGWRGSALVLTLGTCVEVVDGELRRLGRPGIAPPASPPQGAP